MVEDCREFKATQDYVVNSRARVRCYLEKITNEKVQQQQKDAMERVNDIILATYAVPGHTDRARQALI